MTVPRSFDLEAAALRLAGILGEDGLLIGGLAVGAHGYVRATDDVDFVSRAPLAEIRRRLSAAGIQSSIRKGDPSEGDFDCLRGELEGVRFEVLPPLVALDWQQAIEIPIGGNRRLRIVDLDGLIRLKLRAQGPRDLMDVAALIHAHRDLREPARVAASHYGTLERLDQWLADPRLAAEIEPRASSGVGPATRKTGGRKRQGPGKRTKSRR